MLKAEPYYNPLAVTPLEASRGTAGWVAKLNTIIFLFLRAISLGILTQNSYKPIKVL